MILNDIMDNNILEEVVYTISLSLNDLYDLDEVIFSVNNQEICKTVLKNLDKFFRYFQNLVDKWHF